MNRNQIIAVIIAVVSVLAASTTQLTDIFGPVLAKTIGAVCGLATTVLGSVLAVLTGSSAVLSQVDSLKGVDKIVVNANADKTLAKMVVDPSTKVEAAPGAEAAVAKTATQS